MDAHRRLQLREDFRTGEKIEVCEMVLPSRMVRSFRRRKIVHSTGHSSPQDYRIPAYRPEGPFPMGDEEHGTRLSKSDDRGGSSGVQHMPDGRIRWTQTLEIPAPVTAAP